MCSHDRVVTFEDSLIPKTWSRQRSLRCVDVAAAVDCGEKQGPGLCSERRVNLPPDPHP